MTVFIDRLNFKPQPQAVVQSVGRQFSFSDNKKLDRKNLIMLGENARKWHVHRGGKKAEHAVAFTSLAGPFYLADLNLQVKGVMHKSKGLNKVQVSKTFNRAAGNTGQPKKAVYLRREE